MPYAVKPHILTTGKGKRSRLDPIFPRDHKQDSRRLASIPANRPLRPWIARLPPNRLGAGRE